MPSPGNSEQETALDDVLARAKRADAAAWQELHRVFQRPIWRVALTHAYGDNQLAEDLEQEVWLALYRSFHTFVGDGFLPWALTIARRTCRHRNEMKRAQHERAIVPFSRMPEGFDVEDGRTDLLSRMIAEELGDDIVAELAALPRDMRDTLVLSLVREEEERAIAEKLGTSVGTVKSRKSRGKQRLQDRLAGWWRAADGE